MNLITICVIALISICIALVIYRLRFELVCEIRADAVKAIHAKNMWLINRGLYDIEISDDEWVAFRSENTYWMAADIFKWKFEHFYPKLVRTLVHEKTKLVRVK